MTKNSSRLFIKALIIFTVALLTEATASHHETNSSASVSDRDVRKLPQLVRARRVIRDADDVDESHFWMFNQNSSSTHNTTTTQECEREVCTCIAKDDASYDTCTCSDQNVRCWYAGNNCFCKYGKKHCLSVVTNRAAVCPVAGLMATVCRVDGAGAKSEEFQCMPANTDQPCSKMVCKVIEKDERYRPVDTDCEYFPRCNAIIIIIIIIYLFIYLFYKLHY